MSVDFFFFKANQKENLSCWPLIQYEESSSAANLKRCHGERMSSVGEVTDSIHADRRSYQ